MSSDTSIAPDEHHEPAVPLDVLAGFDAWIDADQRRDHPRKVDLTLQLQRCGYQAGIIRGVSGIDVYRLRAL